MRKKKVPEKIYDTELALNYLSEILVEAFLDKMVKEDPNFRDPRINKPVYDLIRNSKDREKNKKINI